MIIQWLLLLTISSFCDTKSYDDYTLYRAIPSNDYQMKFLESIEIKYKVSVVLSRIVQTIITLSLHLMGSQTDFNK